MRLGSLPARLVSWVLVVLFSAWAVVDVLVLNVSSGLAASTYDAMVRARLYAAAPDPRIVIVDIDEASLLRMSREFGRWPWPRDTLATVLEHVEKQQPAAVVWDIVFSDADRLSPGGDAAFNAAVLRSAHSHFSVVRLPAKNDGFSQITRNELPGLWLPSLPSSSTVRAGITSTVALIAPALPAVAAGRMGYNNGYVDKDGVLRRFRYAELLADGSVIQSLPLSVANSVNAARQPGNTTNLGANSQQFTLATNTFNPQNELFAWRKAANIYPLVPFADVFALADGTAPLQAVPSFAGKVVIIGATAPSLHDVHPTPLSPLQAGVDSLATAIDNGLNNRQVAELPRWLQALLAVLLCVGIALWVQVRGVASLAPALLLLPAVLLGISYASLNGLPLFIDLHLAAGLGLVFVATLRIWNSWRRQYWCELPAADGAVDRAVGGAAQPPQGVWSWHGGAPWLGWRLDRLIDAMQTHAPNCRLVMPDTHITWPTTPHWPELARFVAITGPHVELVAAERPLSRAILNIGKSGAARSLGLRLLPTDLTRDALCALVLADWAALAQAPTPPPPQHDLTSQDSALPPGSAPIIRGATP